MYHGDSRLTREERRKLYPSSFDATTGEDLQIDFASRMKIDRESARMNLEYYKKAKEEAKTEAERERAEHGFRASKHDLNAGCDNFIEVKTQMHLAMGELFKDLVSMKTAFVNNPR